MASVNTRAPIVTSKEGSDGTLTLKVTRETEETDISDISDSELGGSKRKSAAVFPSQRMSVSVATSTNEVTHQTYRNIVNLALESEVDQDILEPGPDFELPDNCFWDGGKVYFAINHEKMGIGGDSPDRDFARYGKHPIPWGIEIVLFEPANRDEYVGTLLPPPKNADGKRVYEVHDQFGVIYRVRFHNADERYKYVRFSQTVINIYRGGSEDERIRVSSKSKRTNLAKGFDRNPTELQYNRLFRSGGVLFRWAWKLKREQAYFCYRCQNAGIRLENIKDFDYAIIPFEMMDDMTPELEAITYAARVVMRDSNVDRREKTPQLLESSQTLAIDSSLCATNFLGTLLDGTFPSPARPDTQLPDTQFSSPAQASANDVMSTATFSPESESNQVEPVESTTLTLFPRSSDIASNLVVETSEPPCTSDSQLYEEFVSTRIERDAAMTEIAKQNAMIASLQRELGVYKGHVDETGVRHEYVIKNPVIPRRSFGPRAIVEQMPRLYDDDQVSSGVVFPETINPDEMSTSGIEEMDHSAILGASTDSPRRLQQLLDAVSNDEPYDTRSTGTLPLNMNPDNFESGSLLWSGSEFRKAVRKMKEEIGIKQDERTARRELDILKLAFWCGAPISSLFGTKFLDMLASFSSFKDSINAKARGKNYREIQKYFHKEDRFIDVDNCRLSRKTIGKKYSQMDSGDDSDGRTLSGKRKYKFEPARRRIQLTNKVMAAEQHSLFSRVRDIRDVDMEKVRDFARKYGRNVNVPFMGLVKTDDLHVMPDLFDDYYGIPYATIDKDLKNVIAELYTDHEITELEALTNKKMFEEHILVKLKFDVKKCFLTFVPSYNIDNVKSEREMIDRCKLAVSRLKNTLDFNLQMDRIKRFDSLIWATLWFIVTRVNTNHYLRNDLPKVLLQNVYKNYEHNQQEKLRRRAKKERQWKWVLAKKRTKMQAKESGATSFGRVDRDKFQTETVQVASISSVVSNNLENPSAISLENPVTVERPEAVDVSGGAVVGEGGPPIVSEENLATNPALSRNARLGMRYAMMAKRTGASIQHDSDESVSDAGLGSSTYVIVRPKLNFREVLRESESDDSLDDDVDYEEEPSTHDEDSDSDR